MISHFATLPKGVSPIISLGLPLRQNLGIAVTKAWERPFYRNHWRISSLEEALDRIHNGFFDEFPLIRKSHLRSHFESIIDYSEARDLVSSSGTTGRPVDMPVHFLQEEGRVNRVRRLYRQLGVKPGSRVLQLLSLNDLFTLGVLSWQAIKAEGAIAIRCSPARLDRILDTLKYNRPDFVAGNPYVMVRLAKEAGDRWPDPSELPDGAFFAVAATFTPGLEQTPVAQKAMELWGIKRSLNQYGTSELGPVGYEVGDGQGFALHEDFQYVELVDPTTGRPVEEGQPGEVVVTGLTWPRGFLPFRYATGDMAAWIRTIDTPSGPARRMGPIIGRTDHQLKIFGQTVFPDLLLDLIDQLSEVKRSAVTVKRDPLLGDIVKVLCVSNGACGPAELSANVTRKCNQNLAVSPAVEVVEESFLAQLEQEKLSKTNGSKLPRFFEVG